jgi:MurNAc alpha-1-phosphate uridylyltransferase
MIREYLGDGSRYGAPIHYSEENPAALETGGGIFRALPHLDPDGFLVVNGDVFTDFPFGSLQLEAGHDAHLVLVPNPPQHPRGDFGVVDGRGVPEASTRYTYSGIAAYNHEFFAGCSDGVFPLKPLLLRSMSRGRCAAEVYEGRWEDVGTPARLAALNR